MLHIPKMAIVVMLGADGGASTSFCRWASVSLHVASQNVIDFPRSTVTHDGGRPERTAVAFVGEPLIVEVGVVVARNDPSARGLDIAIERDSDFAGSLHFSAWTRSGDPNSYEGADYVAPMQPLLLERMSLGSHIVRAKVAGCPAESSSVETIRISVRPVETARDRAELHLYRAERAAGFSKDCGAALSELGPVDAFDPELGVGVRAHCANAAGRLQEALQLYRILQHRHEAAGSGRPITDGGRVRVNAAGYKSIISDIERRLAAEGR